MPGKTRQFGQPGSSADPQGVLDGEVRGWIEHVIVPALVSKFLKETSSSKDRLKDNAEPDEFAGKAKAVSQLRGGDGRP
jgi:hypothetical protein